MRPSTAASFHAGTTIATRGNNGASCSRRVLSACTLASTNVYTPTTGGIAPATTNATSTMSSAITDQPLESSSTTPEQYS